MPVQYLQAGQVMPITAHAIQQNAFVFRSNHENDSPGTVGWLPVGGALRKTEIRAGETITFPIEGQAGMLANDCASVVQVHWQNGAVVGPPMQVGITAQELYQQGAAGAEKAIAVGVASGAGLKPSKINSSATSVGTSVQEATKTLTAQWYNAIVAGCRLDPGNFQLFQGNVPLGSTSEDLWNMLDVVPPLSVSNLYNPSQANVFSTDYGSVINNLIPQNSNQFQKDMGDYYNDWTVYLKNYGASHRKPPKKGVDALQLFYNWSQLNMPPNKAQVCYTDYQQVSQGVVPIAVQMWLNAGGGAQGVKAFNSTVANLNDQLNNAPSADVTMDSRTESSNVNHTWAEGKVEGAYDLFFGQAGGAYDRLTMKLASATVQITAKFTHLATFAAAPLSKTSEDPILAKYGPWYNSSALNLGYQNNDNTVWQKGAPTWDNTFGKNGNMLRMTSALVVVDGIETSISSNARLDSSDQQNFRAAAELGFWPFFSATGSGGWSQDVEFDDKGNVNVTSKSVLGNPQILGAIVTPIQNVL